MDFTRVKKKQMAEINVVPYIDVMLVLLVIFMITAPMLMQGVDVDLPQTESEALQISPDTPPLVVSVDAFGAYFVEVGDDRSKPMPLDDVVKRVSTVREANKSVMVLVRGDRNVPYGTIVGLMAALKDAGVANVGLITEKP
ncbi:MULTISPECIES: protein TolR [unclassified Hahella]|uniref:protein TolR n=1 Tax=unclassified Hahella TaxID=2624107 RepID=UPI0020A67803|nr:MULTISPECIES: protein TolR [unclassified Hahella]MDG9668566.1 protein TolR [Hahella sp. CR1]